MSRTILVLHPGDMGAAVAAQLISRGHRVLWLPGGRSEATGRRAQEAGLEPAPDLATTLAEADVVLSVCPPAAAETVASQVAEVGFDGIYVDANAISPQRLDRIAALPGIAAVLDAAIIGPPPRGRGTRLYLAGAIEHVRDVQDLFDDTLVDARAAGTELGKASALKMAFASFQKAARPLAAVAHALARHHGVADLLADEARTMPGDILAATDYLPSVAARAWRWVPEMHEIADTLAAAGLPADQAQAAAVVLTRWEADKDDQTLTLDRVLDRLERPDGLRTAD